MSKLLSGFGALALALGLWLAPGEAEAIPVMYQTGQDWLEAGPLPDELAADPEYADFKSGFMCNVFGLFWAYMHTWDCKPVVFKKSDQAGTDYIYDNSPAVAALVEAKYKPSDIKMPFWQKHGRFVLGGALLLLIIVPLLRRKRT